MSLLKRLFGGGEKAAVPAGAAGGEETARLDYKGFVIRAMPYKDRGQFQLAGTIEKEIGGTSKTHRFVRADRSTMVEEITEMALAKGQKIVDEQGDALFG